MLLKMYGVFGVSIFGLLTPTTGPTLTKLCSDEGNQQHLQHCFLKSSGSASYYVGRGVNPGFIQVPSVQTAFSNHHTGTEVQYSSALCERQKRPPTAPSVPFKAIWILMG